MRTKAESKDDAMTAAITERVHAIAGKMSRKAPTEREDLIQEGMLAAWKAISRYNGMGTLEGWCSFRARGAMYDYLRRIDPLSRDHRKACKSGKEKAPQILSLDSLDYAQKRKI